MANMRSTIKPRSDQLNADDPRLPFTVTVKSSVIREADQQPLVVSYEGDDGRPFKPCLSMRRVLLEAWGDETDDWIGRRMTLFREPKVRFQDGEVGGVRISHLSDLPGPSMKVKLTASRGRRLDYEVKRLDAGAKPEPRPKTAPEPVQAEPPTLPPEIDAKARAAAQQGTMTFREWWKGDEAKPHRPALQSILVELQGIAAEADAKGAPTEPDPFGIEGDGPDAGRQEAPE